MVDLARIKRNVAKMAAMNAPEQDIDGYIASEGVSIEDVKNYQAPANKAVGMLSAFSRGATLGFGDKAGGIVNALGAYLPDRAIEAFTGKNMPSFGDRYGEVVDVSDRAREKFADANPVADFGVEVVGNMVGAGPALLKAVGKTGLTGLKALASAGALEGGIQAASDTKDIADLPQNMAMGTALGGAAPVAMNYGLKPVAKLAQPITNRVTQLAGKHKLAKELAKSGDFSDVKLGNVSDDIATGLNAIRNAEDASPIYSSKVIVPSDRIAHLQERRIDVDKYSPQKAADVIDKALFGKNPQVVRGNEPHLQIIYDKSNPANTAIVGKHRDTGDIFVKTGMNKDRKALDGRSFPSSTVKDESLSPQHLRLSDFQSLYKDNITPDLEKVNSPFGKKSFVDALADRDKSRKMKNAVMSGAIELAESARILQDAIENRAKGMYDEALESVLKTDPLKIAEKKYNDFMQARGNNILSSEKVAGFYDRHPVAKGMIEEMREVDPRAFDQVPNGSLKEFDLLKRALRSEAGQNLTVGASKKDALKRAENSLKRLMEDEFDGFKEANSNYAKAKTNQSIFESKLKKGLTSVGGAVVSPFWSGIASPLTAAGLAAGAFNPMPLAATGLGLGGKALMRAYRRSLGRDIANGVIRTSAKVNPLISFSTGGALRQALLNAMNNKE